MNFFNRLLNDERKVSEANLPRVYINIFLSRSFYISIDTIPLPFLLYTHTCTIYIACKMQHMKSTILTIAIKATYRFKRRKTLLSENLVKSSAMICFCTFFIIWSENFHAMYWIFMKPEDPCEFKAFYMIAKLNLNKYYICG